MKKFQVTLLSLGIMTALGATFAYSAAQDETIERAARELNIMSTIFQTSFAEGEDNARRDMRQGPEARYLAGQGMVFTFNLSGMRSFWNNSNSFNETDWEQFGLQMGQIAQSVVADVAASFPNMDFDFDFDHDYFFDDSNFPGQVVTGRNGVPNAQLSQNQRETIAKMNEAMRERQRAVQEQQRALRDVQRQLRNQNQDLDALNIKLKEMEAALQPQMTALNDQQKAYAAFMEEVAEKAKAQQEALNKQLTSRVVQALCDYGSTLKSQKNDEHITLVFEHYSNDQDQINVFSYKDVAACTSSEKLQQSAVSYLM